MNRTGLVPITMLLLFAPGCGGSHSGSTPAPVAAALAYTAPAGTGWRLVQDPASTSTHLVLDLLAPAGTQGNGITLILTTDPAQATWSPVSGSAYGVQNVYPAPVVNVASVQGSALRLLAAQAPGTPVTYGTAPVLTVALDLVAGIPPGAIALTATQAAHLGAGAPPVAITVAPGTLAAQ